MKFKGLQLLIIFLLLDMGLFSQTLLLAENPAVSENNITVASSNNFPPINLLSDTGQLEGFGRDMSDAVLRSMGEKNVKRIHSARWTEVLQWLDSGKADFIHDTGYTVERESFLDFTTPIIEIPEVIFVGEKSLDIQDINSLFNKKVACVRNHISHIYLQRFPKIECHLVDTPKAGMFSLIAGDVDAFVYPQHIIEYFAQDLKFTDNIKIVGEPIRVLKWSMTVKKGNKELLLRLNEGIAKVQATGEYDRIYQKWFGRSLLSGYSHGEVIFISVVLSIFALLVGAVTALNMTNRKITKAKESAEMSNRAKTEFLALMSHEIRTPMNGVLGMTEILQDTPLNSEQQECLNSIKKSGNVLLSIINDILDFSKLDAGMYGVESIPFNLERLCQESMEMMEGNISGKEVEFIFDYEPECPRYFIGDPANIRQIIINLLGNAVKFTEKGFVRLGVSCQQSESGKKQLRLEVEDSGIGIKPNAINHLFDEFTQADQTTTRKYGGTGLGLAICKKLIKLMDGNIGVHSVYGEGTSFWVTVNLAVTDAPDISAEKPLTGVPILLVDDNEQVCRIFGKMLDEMGVVSTLCTESDKAPKILQQASAEGRPFQIIILDQEMPGINGLELGTSIRKDSQFDDLKMLILSPSGERGESKTFIDAGFNAYLSKVCRYEIFHTLLSTMLGHAQGKTIITQQSIEDKLDSRDKIDKTFNVSVLVVEDVLLNQIITRKFLEKLGVEVSVANNGQQAIDQYQDNHYDLIFMDCRMPVMDGYDATRKIRQLEKERDSKSHIPIIALTANVALEDKVSCMDAGMDGVITKPFKQNDLSNCLNQWFS